MIDIGYLFAYEGGEICSKGRRLRATAAARLGDVPGWLSF